MQNIAVFVSGGGTNLAALIKSQNQGNLKNGRIALVVSSKPDTGALEKANAAGIDSAVIMRKEFETQNDYDAALTKLLRSYSIDCIVLAGFLSILSEGFINEYENRIINVHPSLIPSFCGKGCYGLRVHEMALDYGVKLTGATVHFVNAVPDDGPVILQKSVDIKEDDTSESLQRRVMEEAEWIILPEAVSLFCQGRIKVQGRKTRILEKGRE